MKKQQDIETLQDLSQKHLTWVIKYCSRSFGVPVFLVWYTDNDDGGTTKLLTYKSGEIFGTTSLEGLRETVSAEMESLLVCSNVTTWLEEVGNLEIVEDCTHDISELEGEIAKNNLDIPTIESFANFINLFDDFVYQDLKYAHLQTYLDHELVSTTWDYFYECIFWPRFNETAKFEAWDGPKLDVDTGELLSVLSEIVRVFDENIKLAGRAFG